MVGFIFHMQNVSMWADRGDDVEVLKSTHVVLFRIIHPIVNLFNNKNLIFSQ